MVLCKALLDTQVKERFFEFVKDWSMHVDGNLSANENDIIELFPDFLDSLVND